MLLVSNEDTIEQNFLKGIKIMCMLNKFFIFIILVVPSLALSLPNPASLNCLNKGYQLVLIKNTGICFFPDNSYCEEWAFFRGTCKRGNHFLAQPFIKKNVNLYCITRKKGEVLVNRCHKK